MATVTDSDNATGTGETLSQSIHDIPHPKKRAFLIAYRLCGVIQTAADAAGVDRGSYYDWCEHDEAFAAACRVAIVEAADRLEQKAIDWATNGVPTIKKVFERNKDGEMVLISRTEEQNISPAVLIFALKGAKPDKYRERLDVTTREVAQKVLDATAWESV